MSMDHQPLIRRIQDGDTIKRGETLPSGYRNELMRIMVVFVDSELAGAAGFADLINSGPGLRERMLAARIVSEKFHHAELILDLLQDFGVVPSLYVRSHPWSARLSRDLDLGLRRIGGDKRLNVFHYPITGWDDALVMNVLMGSASLVQLRELQNSSYEPLATAMEQILAQESEHTDMGEVGLAQAIERAGSSLAAQASVDYWYPRVRDAFGHTDSNRIELYRHYGLYQQTNSERMGIWQEEINDRLLRLGLRTPSPAA